jgi:hypothetical protein
MFSTFSGRDGEQPVATTIHVSANAAATHRNKLRLSIAPILEKSLIPLNCRLKRT